MDLVVCTVASGLASHLVLLPVFIFVFGYIELFIISFVYLFIGNMEMILFSLYSTVEKS